MRQTIQPNDFTGLTRPEQFLLHDESAVDYTARLGELMADLGPATYLERRQVELIAQADVDIDRQRRIIAEWLHPSAAVSQAQRSATDWGRAHLAAHRSTASEAENRSPATPQGDPEATPAIARAYTRQRLGLEMHYKALADAEKRRRSAIEFLYAMQDRRAQKQIPDAEVIE